MTNVVISATEASRTFSDVLNRVYYQDKTFEIKRGKEVVAKLIPFNKSANKTTLTTKEMKNFFESLPVLDKEDCKLFEKNISQLRKQDKLGQTKWD